MDTIEYGTDPIVDGLAVYLYARDSGQEISANLERDLREGPEAGYYLRLAQAARDYLRDRGEDGLIEYHIGT